MNKPFDPRQFMIDNAAADLRHYMSRVQLRTMLDLARGEEGDWFVGRMVELAALIQSMPHVYEQDGLGDKAIVYLHYFTGSCDWYITERDTSTEQHQAFGLADLGYGPELGYISINELIQHGVEIDLHFVPRTLGEVKHRKAA